MTRVPLDPAKRFDITPWKKANGKEISTAEFYDIRRSIGKGIVNGEKPEVILTKFMNDNVNKKLDAIINLKTGFQIAEAFSHPRDISIDFY